MNPLATVAHGSISCHFESLEIHLTNACFATTVRNIFILKTMCSPNINPNNVGDLNYIWDVMNNYTWPESTHKRFTEDVKSLRDSPLPQNIILAGISHEELKEACTGWLTIMESISVEHFLADR